MLARLLCVLFALLTLAGCSVADPLADQIHVAEIKTINLGNQADAQKCDLDRVNSDLAAAALHEKTLKWARPLLDKRAAIMRAKLKTQKDLNVAIQHRESLISQWESGHAGQKYHASCFWCF